MGVCRSASQILLNTIPQAKKHHKNDDLTATTDAPAPPYPGPPGPTPGPSPCMATEKKDCKKGCYWCDSAYSPMGQCTDETGAKYLPPTAYTCKKVKKHDVEIELEDTIANADVDQPECSNAHTGKDCVAKTGCQWCTSKQSPMGQCMSDAQAAYMPSSCTSWLFGETRVCCVGVVM